MSWNKQRGMPAVKRETHAIDATGQVVGRLATRIAHLLMGKQKPGFVPHIDQGDFVTVTNAEKIVFTGKKWEQKVHFHSSNRPGGIRRVSMSKLRAERPSEILRHAVVYMLPKNRTQANRMKRLKIS
ncbi:MAG TPA: 50S ribosomal protein L13 [Candidatus Methylomirabilis sp.]|nr:50S ribosomal protein L13 [Candidatus Methylomirabilis sp.]